MKLELVTLTGIKVDQEVYEVQLPTAAGPIGVFPGHEPLVTIAVPGAIMVRFNKGDADNKLEYFAVSGGVIDIDQKRVRVLVDEADTAMISLKLKAKLHSIKHWHFRKMPSRPLNLKKLQHSSTDIKFDSMSLVFDDDTVANSLNNTKFHERIYASTRICSRTLLLTCNLVGCLLCR